LTILFHLEETFKTYIYSQNKTYHYFYLKASIAVTSDKSKSESIEKHTSIGILETLKRISLLFSPITEDCFIPEIKTRNKIMKCE